MNKFAALLLALLLCGCTTAEVTTADQVQQQIVAICAVAVPIANFDPTIGVYATAACASEEMITKLALNPTTVAWLQNIVSELETAKAKVGAVDPLVSEWSVL